MAPRDDAESLKAAVGLLALNSAAMRKLFLAIVQETEEGQDNFNRLQKTATAYHPQKPETAAAVNREVSRILGKEATLNDAQLGALRELFFEPRFSHLSPWPAPTAVW